jgi:hypothetical protein
MKRLPGLLRSHTIDEILALPDFRERVELYREENRRYREILFGACASRAALS